MSIKPSTENKCSNCCHSQNTGGSCGAIYGLGVIGAAFYFFPHVTSFTSGLLAIGKCLVWPALLVYQAFALLHI